MKVALHSFSVITVLMLGGAAAAFSQTPVVSNGGVGVAAGTPGITSVAPGSLISIYGTQLASALSTADTIPLSNSLNNVSVKINDISAPLLFVSPGQINAQLPWEIMPVIPAGTNGTAQVVVTRNGASSAPISFSVAPAAPGIFTFQFGIGQAIAYGNSDGAFAAATGSIPGVSNAHPAKPNDPSTLVILATGLGAVKDTVKSGDVPSVITSETVTKPVVLVGGKAAQVVFSGLVGRDASGKAFGFVGVYQLNIILAADTPTGPAIPLQIQMNGVITSDKVTIAVGN